MQQLQLIGRLGQDSKTIDHAGRKFVAFSLAVDDNYKGENGEKIERTVWYDCTTEHVQLGQYLKKGTQVFLQGKPRVEVYYSEKDGKWYAKTRVAVKNLQLLGSPSDRPAANDLPPAAAQAQPRPAAAVASSQPAGASAGDDDLPF